MNFNSIIVLIAIATIWANAQQTIIIARKIDASKITSTVTNLDLIAPTKGQDKAESCFVYHKGIDALGYPHTKRGRGELIAILPKKACEDDIGEQKEVFIWQVQSVAQPQVDSLLKLKSSGKKVRIIDTDLTAKQKSDAYQKIRYEKSLGNFRLEVVE